MLDLLMRFASSQIPGILQPVAAGQGKPESFKIRIPADHPKANELVKLFKFLETRVVTPSGIEISRKAPLADPVAEFLSMLRDVVEDKESFDQALEQVTQGSRKNDLAAMGMAFERPQVLAALIEAPLAQGFMGDRVEHQDHKKWALKFARKLRDRS